MKHSMGESAMWAKVRELTHRAAPPPSLPYGINLAPMAPEPIAAALRPFAASPLLPMRQQGHGATAAPERPHGHVADDDPLVIWDRAAVRRQIGIGQIMHASLATMHHAMGKWWIDRIARQDDGIDLRQIAMLSDGMCAALHLMRTCTHDQVSYYLRHVLTRRNPTQVVRTIIEQAAERLAPMRPEMPPCATGRGAPASIIAVYDNGSNYPSDERYEALIHNPHYDPYRISNPGMPYLRLRFGAMSGSATAQILGEQQAVETVRAWARGAGSVIAWGALHPDARQVAANALWSIISNEMVASAPSRHRPNDARLITPIALGLHRLIAGAIADAATAGAAPALYFAASAQADALVTFCDAFASIPYALSWLVVGAMTGRALTPPWIGSMGSRDESLNAVMQSLSTAIVLDRICGAADEDDDEDDVA